VPPRMIPPVLGETAPQCSSPRSPLGAALRLLSGTDGRVQERQSHRFRAAQEQCGCRRSGARPNAKDARAECAGVFLFRLRAAAAGARFALHRRAASPRCASSTTGWSEHRGRPGMCSPSRSRRCGLRLHWLAARHAGRTGQRTRRRCPTAPSFGGARGHRSGNMGRWRTAAARNCGRGKGRLFGPALRFPCCSMAADNYNAVRASIGTTRAFSRAPVGVCAAAARASAAQPPAAARTGRRLDHAADVPARSKVSSLSVHLTGSILG